MRERRHRRPSLGPAFQKYQETRRRLGEEAFARMLEASLDDVKMFMESLEHPLDLPEELKGLLQSAPETQGTELPGAEVRPGSIGIVHELLVRIVENTYEAIRSTGELFVSRAEGIEPVPVRSDQPGTATGGFLRGVYELSEGLFLECRLSPGSTAGSARLSAFLYRRGEGGARRGVRGQQIVLASKDGTPLRTRTTPGSGVVEIGELVTGEYEIVLLDSGQERQKIALSLTTE